MGTELLEQSPSLPAPIASRVAMRELSTERQGVWIERLFTRLSARYGASFGRQWEGTNLAKVKEVWTEELGGFTADQMAGALKAIETNTYPPNLPEFIAACRRAAADGLRRAEAVVSLPAPDIPPEVIAHRLRVLNEFGRTFGKRDTTAPELEAGSAT